MNSLSSVRTLLILALSAAFLLPAQEAGAQVVQVNTGTPANPLYAVGPVYVSSTLFYTSSRYAYLYTEPELATAGLQPGSMIQEVGWMKSTANSAAGPATFKIYMKNSAVAAYANATASWANLVSGADLVYNNLAQSIPATATPNYIDFPLSAPFTYSGGSLEILTEWDISAASEPFATGSFEWENTIVPDRIYGMGNTSLPTSLSSTSNNTNIDNRRPVIQFNLDPNAGMGTLSAAASMMVYPNPTDQVLNIRNGGRTAVGNITVLDVLGKQVQAEERRGSRESFRIDVADLMAGTYFLRMETASGPLVKRFAVR